MTAYEVRQQSILTDEEASAELDRLHQRYYRLEVEKAEILRDTYRIQKAYPNSGKSLQCLRCGIQSSFLIDTRAMSGLHR